MGTTPSVQYLYDDGAGSGDVAAYVRLTDVIYPSASTGRDVHYGYGDSSSTDINRVIDAIMSRLETISNAAETEIYAKYTYLGAGRIVEEDYVDSGVKFSYLNSSGNVL